MAREEAQQTREKKHGSNPGTFSPDDDEAHAADVTRAGQRPDGQGRDQRQSQSERQNPSRNADQMEAAEAEDFEDDDDDADDNEVDMSDDSEESDESDSRP